MKEVPARIPMSALTAPKAAISQASQTNLGGLFGELRGERQTNLNVAPPSATFPT
jgi:hypothetical protein